MLAAVTVAGAEWLLALCADGAGVVRESRESGSMSLHWPRRPEQGRFRR